MDSRFTQYLPSKSFAKKILIIVGGIVLVVGINYYLNYRKTHSQVAVQPLAVPVTVSDLATIDANGNGIPDWQDNIQKAGDLHVLGSAKDTGPINETDQLARDVFTASAVVSQSGSLTDQGAQDIATSLVNQIGSQTNNTKYTLSDIHVVKENDTTLVAYIKAMSAILKNNPQNTDHSLAIIQSALQNNDAGSLAQLDSYIKNYRAMVDKLKKTNVPDVFIESHLAMMNSAENIAGALESFKVTFDNPVVAMGALYNYPNYLVAYANSMQLYVNTLKPYGTK